MKKIFDFKCTVCEEVQERFVEANDKVVDCKKCGKPAKRIISGVGGFQFKGTGFYTTDYKNK